jgi:hypothetical protein
MDPNSDVEWEAASQPGCDVHVPTDDESIT